MQRRAAAIYFAFFLVVGAAAYAYIGVAQSTQQPQFSLDGTQLQANGSTTIDGTQYSVTELGHASSGGGGGELEATLEYTNESAVQTATLENDSSVTYEGTDYTVVIPGENATSFTLREEQNVSAILVNDQAVENSLATQNDTEYVVFRENDSLRPASEYLPAPETREFSTGDAYQYEGNQSTVAEITSSEVTLERTAPETETHTLTEGTNVTLANGQQYFAHIPGEEELLLVPSGQYDDYAHTLDEQAYFDERINGLWGIVIISGIAAFLIVSMAYLPHRG